MAANNLPPKLLDAVAVPNPVPHGPFQLALRLEGNAERIHCQLFSPAMVLIKEADFEGAFVPGIQLLPFNALDWPSGLLYLNVTASGHGGSSRKIAKLWVMP